MVSFAVAQSLAGHEHLTVIVTFSLPAIVIVRPCVHIMSRARAPALNLSAAQIACHPRLARGMVKPDSGRIHLVGSEVSFATPSAANAAGVVCIFQNLAKRTALLGVVSAETTHDDRWYDRNSLARGAHSSR